MSYGSPSPYGQPNVPQAPANNTNVVKILLIVGAAVLMVMLSCGGVMVALLLPAVSAARQAAQRVQSSNNMKMIGLALHNYHAAYNSLPPAYLTDANGTPTLSWRVLILPFIEEQPLYEQFDLEQSWNSPTNAVLAVRRPMVYAKPGDDDLPSDRTAYVAIRSPQSLFPDATPLSFRTVTDGTANTIAIVDNATNPVVWTAPDDTSPADFLAAFKQSSTPLQVLFCDAAVRAIDSSSTPESTVQAYMTRNGGESVPYP